MMNSRPLQTWCSDTMSKNHFTQKLKLLVMG